MDFKDMPWQMKLSFVAYTLPGIMIIIPALIIALLNPLWFRQDMLRGVENLVNTFSHYRSKWMKPQLDKWSLFNTIKKS